MIYLRFGDTTAPLRQQDLLNPLRRHDVLLMLAGAAATLPDHTTLELRIAEGSNPVAECYREVIDFAVAQITRTA